MKKKVMVLGAGPYQLPAIRKAQNMGCEVVATDMNPNAVGLKVADYPYGGDLKDIEGCLQIAKKHHIDAILTVAVEVAVKTVAAIAAELDLPGISPEAAAIATDKSLMRESFDKFGVPSPVSLRCWSLEEAQTASQKIGFPVVVKPADNAGSRGVSKVDTPTEIPAAYQMALAHSQKGLVLVEEFMEGVEISVEAFVYKGQVYIMTLSDKIRSEPPVLLDTTVLFPSNHLLDIQNSAQEVASRAIKATGIDMSTVHSELMVTSEGPKMVELAARGAGFRVFTDIIPWVTGIDVVEELIKIALGMEPDLDVKYHRGAVLRFPEVPPGIVKRVIGVDEARVIKGVFDLDVYVEPGDTVQPLRSGSDRVWHIISMVESRREAVRVIEEVEKVLRIEVA